MHRYGEGFALHPFAMNHGNSMKIRSESSMPISPAAPAAPLQGIRLLVVDDSKINLLVAEKLLKHAGAAVHLADDGREALAWLKEHGQETDLVFLDVQMPIMDGLTAVGLIRSELGLHDLPVIAMTGADSDQEMAHALACGMTDHLIKPFNYKTLVSVVLQYASTGAASAGSLEAEAGISDAVDWPEIAGIDTPKAQYGHMGDRESFLKQLRRLLMEFEPFQTPPMMPVDQQAWRELAMQMHKLVGNAGLLAAPALTMAARQAEWLATAGETQGLSDALQEVAAQLLLLKQGMSALVLKQPKALPNAMVPAALDRAAVVDWVRELEDQSFSAVKRFALLSSTLAMALGAARMSELTTAMEGLEFERALEIVKPLAETE